MKKKRFAIFFVLLLLLNLVACNSKTEQTNADGKVTVKIGYLPITHAMPLYLEEELLKQGNQNINVELIKFGSWPELLDALNTGRIDGASVLVELAMKAKEQGIDLKAVALGHKDGNAIIVAPEINGVNDLKGKTFAIPHRQSTHNLLLYQMLKNEGLHYDDVNVVELPPAEMPAALSEGRIAGYVVAEPFGAQAVALEKGKVLFQSEELWPESVCCALVLRGDFIEKNKATTEEFVRQYAEAGKKAEQKNAEVHKTAAKYMKVDKEVLDLSLKWISYDDLRLNEKEYEELRQLLIEMNLSENPPKYEEFVDNSFIDKVK